MGGCVDGALEGEATGLGETIAVGLVRSMGASKTDAGREVAGDWTDGRAEVTEGDLSLTDFSMSADPLVPADTFFTSSTPPPDVVNCRSI